MQQFYFYNVLKTLTFFEKHMFTEEAIFCHLYQTLLFFVSIWIMSFALYDEQDLL